MGNIDFMRELDAEVLKVEVLAYMGEDDEFAEDFAEFVREDLGR